MSFAETDSVDRRLGAFSDVDSTDPEDFIERLDKMHALDSFKMYKRETFDLMRLDTGNKAADIGCGTGEDSRMLTGITGNSGEIIGIDLSEAMVAEARERHGDMPGLRFMQASSDTLDLSDNSLDAIRADRVLIHVPDADASLDEMIRVTRPGGRVVISEPDMPGFWVASDHYDTTDLLINAVAKSCVRPYLPRDLWTMFNDHGLTDIEFSVRTITSTDLPTVTKVLDFTTVIKMALAQNMLSEEQAAGWMNDQLNRGQSGRFVAGLSIMIASGTKP